MRILFTVLIGLLYCSNAFGQALELKRLPHEALTKIRPIGKARATTASILPSSGVAHKTLESDTVFYEAHIWGQDSTQCGGQIYNYPDTLSFFGGYLNGTMGPVPLLQGGGLAVLAEHGINLKVPKKLGAEARIFGLLVAFAPGTMIVGEADEFAVNVWQASPINSSTATPTFSTPLNLENLPNGFNTEGQFSLVPFDDIPANYDKISNNMLFSIQTAITGGDDTLKIYFNSSELQCDPDHDNNWYYRIMKVDNGVIGAQVGPWVELDDFFQGGVPDDQQPNVLLMVPIVIYTTTVGVDEAVTSNGLTMLNAYPNPTTEEAKVRFNLARNGNATIKVIDLTGREVLPEVKFDAAKGLHEHTINTRNLACGQYICVIQTNQGSLATRISVEK